MWLFFIRCNCMLRNFDGIYRAVDLLADTTREFQHQLKIIQSTLINMIRFLIIDSYRSINVEKHERAERTLIVQQLLKLFLRYSQKRVILKSNVHALQDIVLLIRNKIESET